MDGGLSISAFINGLGDVRSGQITGILSTTWYLIQVIAASTVLFLEWGNACDQKLGLWLSVATCRIVLRLLLSAAALKLTRSTTAAIANAQERGSGSTASVNTHSEHATMIEKMKEVLDVFGLVWFTLGNAWVFGSRYCRLTSPGIFYLSLSIIVVTYVVMLFPIILALLFIPFACFCLPCFLRLLVRFREAENQRGATRAQINTLPTVKYSENMFGEDNGMCPICLAEYTEGEAIRLLKCSGSHHFHVACVDQWLQLNSICPCCRENIMGNRHNTTSNNSRNNSSRGGQQQQQRGREIPSSESAERREAERDLEHRLSAMEEDRGDWTIVNDDDDHLAGAAGGGTAAAATLPTSAATAAASPGGVRSNIQSFTEHSRISLRALMMGVRFLGEGRMSLHHHRTEGSAGSGSGGGTTVVGNRITLSQLALPLSLPSLRNRSPDNSWFEEDEERIEDSPPIRPAVPAATTTTTAAAAGGRQGGGLLSRSLSSRAARVLNRAASGMRRTVSLSSVRFSAEGEGAGAGRGGIGGESVPPQQRGEGGNGGSFRSLEVESGSEVDQHEERARVPPPNSTRSSIPPPPPPNSSSHSTSSVSSSNNQPPSSSSPASSHVVVIRR